MSTDSTVITTTTMGKVKRNSGATTLKAVSEGAVPTKTNSDTPDPADFPSISSYLEAVGKVEFTTDDQLLLARNLFTCKNVSAANIAKQIGISVSVVKHWIYLFGWEDARDRKLYADFKKINNFRKVSRDLETRSDKVLHSIEEIAASIVEKHIEGGVELAPKDLKILNDLVANSYTTRKLIQNSGNPQVHKSEITHHLSIDDSVVNSVVYKIRAVEPKKLMRRDEIEIEAGNVQDAEFETS